MKKILKYLILLIIIISIFLIIILSTTGIETNKFNKLISNKASQTKNIILELKTIKFKIDIKELSLFLETQKPSIIYREILIPTENIKVYIDFISLLKSKPKITKTNLVLKELDVSQLKKLLTVIKPSNFKSLLSNKIKGGRLISEIELYFRENGSMENFIARGEVRNFKIEILNNFNFTNTNFNFFADNKDVLIKNISGNLEEIKITEGDIKLNFEDGTKFNSNFNSKINLNEQIIKKYNFLFKKINFINKIKIFDANFNNNLSIDFDPTYKIKNYNYSINGELERGELELSKPVQNIFITNEIKNIFLSNIKIKTNYSPKNFEGNGEGRYSLNNLNFQKLNFENNIIKDLFNLKLNLEYQNNFEIGLINYKKNKDSIANILLDYKKKKNETVIKKFNFTEGNDTIKISDLIIKKNKISSFKKIFIETKNNNFFIQNDGKITIEGNKFDATNLVKFLGKQDDENKFQNFDGEIEIDFKNIKVPMSERLENFKLIGEIKKGQFVKISSKGDFGGNNFLDISMKKNNNNEKKYLEIYSDLTRPLLTEYSFFKGLSGGKLLFTSVIEKSNSNSRLKIENFKVVNAPGVIKLLSLADLGGLADLAEGEGLSFDVLEISMEKNKNFLKINEILALGPSISVLMEGFQDQNGLTSLRGTLVPAKTLNKMISKIPVIGNIVIPKEVGEGLFGISFKMKGPKGKIKTTINPIKTITPRFIQKIIERNKALK